MSSSPTFEGLKSGGLPFLLVGSKGLGRRYRSGKEAFSHPLTKHIQHLGRIFLASKLWMTNNLYAGTLPGYL